MAKLGINTGSVPNDGTGDSLIDGAIKINSNFDEIYSTIGDGSTLAVPVTSIAAGSNISVSGATGNVTITGLANTANVTTDSLVVAGISTLTGTLNANGGVVGNVTGSSSQVTVSDESSDTTCFPLFTNEATGNLEPKSGTNLTFNSSSGALTATSFSGSGTDITGIVTSITAGSNISVSGATGNVTITGLANTANVTTNSLVVSGISTFTGNIDANGSISLPDNSGGGGGGVGRLTFGDGQDFRLFHDGTDNHIEASGLLNLQSHGVSIFSFIDSEKLADFNLNDSVDLYYDGVKKFETTGTGVTVFGTTQTQQLNVSGIGTFSGQLRLPGGTGVTNRIELGNAQEFTLQYNTTSSRGLLTAPANNIEIQAKSIKLLPNLGENGVIVNQNGSVELYYDNAERFETTGTGVTVFGTTQTQQLNTQQLNASGVSTFSGTTNFNGFSEFNGDVQFDGNIDFYDSVEFKGTSGASSVHMYDENAIHFGDQNDGKIIYNNTGNIVKFERSGSAGEIEINATPITLKHTSNTKLQTTSTGVVITGVATATSFSGDGSNLVDGKWNLGADGSTNYTFDGPGFSGATNDPILYLARGQTYEFVNGMNAHPFQIRVSNGGAAYNTGVTNNGTQNGTVKFEIPMDAPNTLYYQCTSHAGMGNTISVYPNTI